jgi:hypothetical protein
MKVCKRDHTELEDGAFCPTCGLQVIGGETIEGTAVVPDKEIEIEALEKKVLKVRRSVYWAWGVIILQVAGCFVFFGLYSHVTVNDGSSSTASALASFASNDANAQTAPQQAVVNGWVARDLLSTIAGQNSTIITMQNQANYRSEWLLFNGLVTMGLIGIALIRLGLMIYYQTILNTLKLQRGK